MCSQTKGKLSNSDQIQTGELDGCARGPRDTSVPLTRAAALGLGHRRSRPGPREWPPPTRSATARHPRAAATRVGPLPVAATACPPHVAVTRPVPPWRGTLAPPRPARHRRRLREAWSPAP
ncbi:unnamed protein product [Urochloa humidicola]